MTDLHADNVVPIWTLGTSEGQQLPVPVDGPMTPERLHEWRTALAMLADRPIVTLEAHPLTSAIDRSSGIALDAASPLARHLTQLIGQTSTRASRLADDGEILYRMVVPAKHAGAFGSGAIRLMRSSSVDGGVRSALVGAKGVVSHASFVPVTAGTAAVGTGAAGAATALTVATPLVLMAVAVGVSAAAEKERQAAIEHITDLLERLHEQHLDLERGELEGCRDAIEKATALLLDQGKLGVSLGLDSAAHAIGKALAAADRRLAGWQKALDGLGADGVVEVDALFEAFPGLEGDGGLFRAHLELAALAIALKRRVVVLQAVEHAQHDDGNLLENFSALLRTDQRRLDELESSIAEVLVRISRLALARPRGLRAPVFTANEVDRLLGIAHRLHSMSADIRIDEPVGDMAIEIARQSDGSVVVLPARSVSSGSGARSGVR